MGLPVTSPCPPLDHRRRAHASVDAKDHIDHGPKIGHVRFPTEVQKTYW